MTGAVKNLYYLDWHGEHHIDRGETSRLGRFLYSLCRSRDYNLFHVFPVVYQDPQTLSKEIFKHVKVISYEEALLWNKLHNNSPDNLTIQESQKLKAFITASKNNGKMATVVSQLLEISGTLEGIISAKALTILHTITTLDTFTSKLPQFKRLFAKVLSSTKLYSNALRTFYTDTTISEQECEEFKRICARLRPVYLLFKKLAIECNKDNQDKVVKAYEILQQNQSYSNLCKAATKIPLKISPFFFILPLIGGWLINKNMPHRLLRTTIFVGMNFIFVLVHEFGHALTARYFGDKPRIELWALGALTYTGRYKQLTNWQNFLMTLNGVQRQLGLPINDNYLCW